MLSLLAAGAADAASFGAVSLETVSLETVSLDATSLGAMSPFDLGRGAIAGAYIVGAAFLAGYAAIRQSSLGLCAFAMVALAAALEFSWLGLFSGLSAEISVLFLGLFAAAAIVFVSASIDAAKYNPLVGGVMFTAALIFAGLGFINLLGRVDATALMRWGAVGVGGMSLLLAASQAFRGDAGARLILPGLVLALAAPLFGSLGAASGPGSLLPHGLFTLGVLSASLVALTDGFGGAGAPSLPEGFVSHHGASADPSSTHAAQRRSGSEANGAADRDKARKRERADIVIDSQLGKVLDYSGVAIWDWSPEFVDQTESFATLLGADRPGDFTPEALREFIDQDQRGRFDAEVLAMEDGPFDVALKLYDGRWLRIRGARAASETQEHLERIVAFVEEIEPAKSASSARHPVDGDAVRAATAAAIVPTGALGKPAPAFDVKTVSAVFQPIVSLPEKTIVGYETLARRDGEKDQDAGGVIEAAQAAGQSLALARRMLEKTAEHLAGHRKDKDRANAAALFGAMNVSWSQMSDPAFLSAVKETIAAYRLPERALVLELTEGEAVPRAGAALSVFRALRAAGAALAFDDFGAGFSCLGNIRNYEFDYIKIDKSFADDLENNADGAKIVSALASMGAELGLKVIVEGIENEAAASAAQKLGCAYAQGYYFGRPEYSSSRKSPRADASRASSQKAAGPESAQRKAADKGEREVMELTPDLAVAGKAARWRPWKDG